MHIIKRWTLVLGERMSRGVCPAGEVMKGHREAILCPTLKDEKKKAKREPGKEIWG